MERVLEGNDLKLKEYLDDKIISFQYSNLSIMAGILLGLALSFFLMAIFSYLEFYFKIDKIDYLFFSIILLCFTFVLLKPYIEAKNKLYRWDNQFFKGIKWRIGV